MTSPFTYKPAGQVQTSSANTTAYDYDQLSSVTEPGKIYNDYTRIQVS